MIKEECGVFGIVNDNAEDTAGIVCCGLYALQHRGQESCGIAVNDSSSEGAATVCYKDTGLVSEVFTDDILAGMKGDIAIGHVRYSTSGGNTRENAQPLATKYIKGTLAIAHNGNIANADELRRQLESEGAIFHCTSDTEVIAFLIARKRLTSPTVEDAVARVIPMLRGSFSLLVMSPRKLIAVRDPYGIRPLCLGRLGGGYVVASESCALDTVHAEFIRDVEPGETLVIEHGSLRRVTDGADGCPYKNSALCIFEHIYFARPDSVIDGQSVYEARIAAGRLLARTHPVDADMVCGVPDSGLIAARGYSLESGIPQMDGLIKNRYIGRTFIQPTQAMRETSVGIKLNALRCNVEGKRVVMVDDSIVRGTTTAHLIERLKKAGAREVHVRISSPMFLYPCYFGTDIPDRDKLACNKYTLDELCGVIGADSLGFLPLEELRTIAPSSRAAFCDGCFSGKYPYKEYDF